MQHEHEETWACRSGAVVRRVTDDTYAVKVVPELRPQDRKSVLNNVLCLGLTRTGSLWLLVGVPKMAERLWYWLLALNLKC